MQLHSTFACINLGYGVRYYDCQIYHVDGIGGVSDIWGTQNNGDACMSWQVPAMCDAQAAYRYPNARQKELKIKPFDVKELCEGLGSGS